MAAVAPLLAGSVDPLKTEAGAIKEAKKHMSWYVNGEEYDLTEFMHKHPGGPDFLMWSQGRDISIPVHAYHKNPALTVVPLLEQYKVERPAAKKDAIKQKLGIPHFLLPDQFDAVDDIPEYDWDFKNDKLLLNTARKLINNRDVQQKIKRLDTIFDCICFGLFLCYVTLVVFWLKGSVPWWIAVPLFAILRTGMAGGGHYFVHRKKPLWCDSIFDINYVGMAYTAQDGHVLIHHMYTQSDADVKRGFFGGMMGVPRLLRMPVHTLHKLGHVTTGMMIRGVELENEPDNDEHQGAPIYIRKNFGRVQWNFWVLHIWLRIELCLALFCGLGWSWLGQFCATLWMNTLMVVSSHDFTETFAKDEKDWGRYQLLNAHDMRITGNRWIDCFLSAGLSPHRAHHVFPYQKSGYANIYSEQFLEQAAIKHGLPWVSSKSWFTEIFPMVGRMYLWAPVSDPIIRKPQYASMFAEHTDPACYKYIAQYIKAGFMGCGSL
jgi:hypothetical protein